LLVQWFANRYRHKANHVVVRLCRALAIGADAGLPTGMIIEMGVLAASAPEITAHVAQFTAAQKQTQPLAQTFKDCPLLPQQMHAYLDVAQRTGDRSTPLLQLARLLESGIATKK